MHLIHFKGRAIAYTIVVFGLIGLSYCKVNNLCSKHSDCPSDTLCYSKTPDKKGVYQEIGACMSPSFDTEDSDTEIFKNIRRCSEDADCDDCSSDPDEEWGCLDKGGTIHNCMLKRDGKFQDPIIKDLWKKCEKK